MREPWAPRLFSLGIGRLCAERVAERLANPLGGIEKRDFEDGEHKTRPLESVRGRSVFVVQSIRADTTLTVNDVLCRLLFLLAALKDAGA